MKRHTQQKEQENESKQNDSKVMTDMKAVGERGQKEHLCSHVRTQLGFL